MHPGPRTQISYVLKRNYIVFRTFKNNYNSSNPNHATPTMYHTLSLNTFYYRLNYVIPK